MSDATFEKVEPVLAKEVFPKIVHKSFIWRPEHDAVKIGMGVHPAPNEAPFQKVTFEGTDFYRIEKAWWQLSHVGSDDIGIFVEFYRMDGEFKGYRYD